jgi:hypothetical protein
MPEYDGLFQIYKVIYPDYASRHHVGELETFVVDTFTQCSAIYLNTTDFFLAIETSLQGHELLNQPNHSTASWASSTGTFHIGKPTNIAMHILLEIPRLPILTPPILVWSFAFRVFRVDIRSSPTMR